MAVEAEALTLSVSPATLQSCWRRSEIHEEWQVGRRYFSQESMRKLNAPEEGALTHTPALRLAPIH